MISIVIKKEILENLLTLRFAVLTLFCVILIPLSFYFNYKSYQTHLNDYRETVRLHQEKLNTVYARNYTEKMKGFRAPSPLMVFARGLEDILPRWVTATKSGPEFGKATSSQEAIQTFVENVDFHFIIKFIFSLVALLFSFNLICGEKEKGTIRQTLANSIPRHQLLLGKIIGSYSVLIIPFLFSFVIGLLLLSFLAPELLSGENLLRIFSIMVTSLLYVSVFFTLGLLISTETKNTITALVILLFLWILIVFVIPGVSNILAKIVYPVKTEQVLNLEKDLIQKQINKEKAEALKDILLRFQEGGGMGGWTEEGRKRFEQYQKARKPIAKKFEEREQKELAKLDREYWQDKQHQEKLTVLFSRLSPAPAFSYAITNFTNTGLACKHDFNSAAINFNMAMNDEVYSKIWRDEFMFGEASRISQGGFYESPPKEVNNFSFEGHNFSESLSHSWVDILLLVIYNILFFIGSYVAFLRYDVR